MKIDPRHLVQLSVIVEHRSFSKAASSLGLTQPALSRNIRLLEERVGALVLERERGNIRPTAIGRRLAAHGAVIRMENGQAAMLADHLAQGLAGEIRLGAPPLISEHLLPEPLIAFAASYPDVTYRIRTGIMSNLIDQLLAGELDLVMGPVGVLEKPSGLYTDLILEDRIVLLGRAGHPLTAKQVIEPDDLQNAGWIAMSRQSFIRSQMDAALASIGLSQISVRFECQSEAMMIRLLEGNDLVTMLPHSAMVRLAAERQLTELAFDHPALRHPIGVVHRGDARLSHLQVALRDALISHFVDRSFEGLETHQ